MGWSTTATSAVTAIGITSVAQRMTANAKMAAMRLPAGGKPSTSGSIKISPVTVAATTIFQTTFRGVPPASEAG